MNNGFRTDKELERQDYKEYLHMCALKDKRWEMGLGLLSSIDELLLPVNIDTST